MIKLTYDLLIGSVWHIGANPSSIILSIKLVQLVNLVTSSIGQFFHSNTTTLIILLDWREAPGDAQRCLGEMSQK